METAMESPMIEDLKEEGYIISFLKQIFLREPSKDFLKEIGEINVVSEENDIDKGLNMIANAVRVKEEGLDEYTEELATEFARLFIGPKDPPAIPYASYYLSERKIVMSEITSGVRKRYLEAGMAVKNLYSAPDDHIGIELEFIAYLAKRIIELYEDGQHSEAARLFEIKSNFINEHMSRWVPLFVKKILESTNEDYFRGAAIILGDIISEIR